MSDEIDDARVEQMFWRWWNSEIGKETERGPASAYRAGFVAALAQPATDRGASMTNPRVPATEAATYCPNEAESLADRLLQSIAFKVYTTDDDIVRDAAAMLKRLAHQPSVDREAAVALETIGWGNVPRLASDGSERCVHGKPLYAKCMGCVEAFARAALASSTPAESGEGDTAEDGWCRRCGCGNDRRGFAHLAKCPSRDEIGRLREALEQCRDQFAFYAREHGLAGKHEKRETNQRFVNICSEALATNDGAS